jgi:hypothetical protein
MADPTDATTIPHLIGITLITAGVALTPVIAYNRTTGGTLIRSTDANKRVVFDLANMDGGYSANDVIEFTNVSGSVGSTTVTVNSATGDVQLADLTAAAASTVSTGM